MVFGRSFPGIAEGLRNAQEVFENVKSFEDIELIFFLL
jgi:hypothetical protein